MEMAWPTLADEAMTMATAVADVSRKQAARTAAIDHE
jgi:hypothetical protein